MVKLLNKPTDIITALEINKSPFQGIYKKGDYRLKG